MTTLLLLLPAGAVASPASGLSVSLASHGEGDVLHADGWVDVRVVGAPEDADVAGWIELDGETVGTFIRKAAERDGDVRVPIDASRLARGERALVAHAFTHHAQPTASDVVRVQLNHPPRAETLWATYDPEGASLRVGATLREDGDLVRVDLESPLGTVNLTQEVRNGSAFLDAAQSGRLWRGTYPLRLDLTDADGATRSVKTTFVVHDRAASVAHLTAWTVRGASMHVHAQASDPDGPIERAILYTLHGEAESRVVDGVVNLTLDDVHLGLGEHRASLRLVDAHGGSTYVPVAFHVEGTRRVLHEEVIDMSYGGRASVLWKKLPTLRDASLRVCEEQPDGACARWTHLDPGVVELRLSPWAPACALTPLAPVGACRFDTGPTGADMELAWALAGSGRFRILLEGTELT